MPAYIHNRKEVEQQIVVMNKQDGWSLRALTRHFGISRNMVRRIIRKHEKLRDHGPDILLGGRQVRPERRGSKLDPYEGNIKRLLEKYPHITGERLFEELRVVGYDAFAYFNGTPAQCLYDSEKTVVLRWEAGKPVINPAFADFSTHYRIRPVICQRRHPETKGKVERPFQYVEGNLLSGREFQDIEDLRACARWWMKEKSDMHRHETTGRPPEAGLNPGATIIFLQFIHPAGGARRHRYMTAGHL